LESAKIFNGYIEQTSDPAGKSVMFSPGRFVQVYLVVGSTDMRKSIDSLSILVADRLDLDPFSGYLFCFRNRKRDTVKVLYWDRNGLDAFCLLESHKW
jgi:transposase